jgi:hypothetical protein
MESEAIGQTAVQTNAYMLVTFSENFFYDCNPEIGTIVVELL